MFGLLFEGNTKGSAGFGQLLVFSIGKHPVCGRELCPFCTQRQDTVVHSDTGNLVVCSNKMSLCLAENFSIEFSVDNINFCVVDGENGLFRLCDAFDCFPVFRGESNQGIFLRFFLRFILSTACQDGAARKENDKQMI